MLKKLIKNKRASEVVQNLIVIAIMGALAIGAISGIAGKLNEKNDVIVEGINDSIKWEAN